MKHNGDQFEGCNKYALNIEDRNATQILLFIKKCINKMPKNIKMIM